MIPFPRMHIAESVLNRIHNTLMDKQSPLNPVQLAPPIAADPTALGLELDEKLEQPADPVEVPPEAQGSADAGMLDASLQGGSPFDGALTGTLGVQQ